MPWNSESWKPASWLPSNFRLCDGWATQDQECFARPVHLLCYQDISHPVHAASLRQRPVSKVSSNVAQHDCTWGQHRARLRCEVDTLLCQSLRGPPRSTPWDDAQNCTTSRWTRHAPVSSQRNCRSSSPGMPCLDKAAHDICKVSLCSSQDGCYPNQKGAAAAGIQTDGKHGVSKGRGRDTAYDNPSYFQQRSCSKLNGKFHGPLYRANRPPPYAVSPIYAKHSGRWLVAIMPPRRHTHRQHPSAVNRGVSRQWGDAGVLLSPAGQGPGQQKTRYTQQASMHLCSCSRNSRSRGLKQLPNGLVDSG